MIISNLATFYEGLGRYEEAEPLLVKCNALLEKLIGEHYIFATNLNNLANLYHLTGRFEQADKLYARAKSIREKTIGKAHRDYYFQSLNNMADLYRSTKRYTEAESFFLEAMELARQNGDAAHPDYATTLNNLANLYQEVGRLKDAEKTYLDGCASMKEALGTGHPRYAICLSNLTNFYSNTGRAEIALPLCEEALATLDKTLGKKNAHYLSCLYNLALIHRRLGQTEAAEAAFLEAGAIQRSLLAASTRYLSEREKASYVSLFLADIDYSLAFLQTMNSGRYSPLIGAAYDNALFLKGFLLTASIKIRQIVGANPDSERDFLLLVAYHRRLAAQYSLAIAERDNAVVVELEEKANDLEKGLVRTMSGYGDAMRQVNWQEVQQQLKPREAAVEFIQYRYYNPKATDSIMYAALLLKPAEEMPQFITLFEERNISALIKGASGKAIGKINVMYAREDTKPLYDLIWKPLEPYLEGVKKVYCSPSGVLYRLNLGAIAVNDSEIINDRYRIVTLSSTRRLVVPDAVSRISTDAVLIGGVRYRGDPTTMSTAVERINTSVRLTDMPFHTDTLTRGGSWTYLPETALEVMDIQNLLQSAKWTTTLDTGYYATEEAFRNIGQGKPSPRILHVATHGFFYPDPKENPQSAIRKSQSDEPVFKLSEHPMIRSGLLLAGADEVWSTGKAPQNREDGVLTAYEISQMNLSNTELVVLSACETGLGEIEGNEGVYGLQRAFKIAGAKYLIMSLWEVSDKSTRELMTDFYRQWLVKGLEIPEAFRKAQHTLQMKYPKAPYLWAGFVLVE